MLVDQIWDAGNGVPPSLLEPWRALVSDIPQEFWIKPPLMCGEHGWRVSGVILNPDTLVYQERISLLYDAGVIGKLKRPRILEIGGGYGALARALWPMVGRGLYVICDLPESLMFAGLYLTLTTDAPVALNISGDEGYLLLPNYWFHELRGPFDLVINTISMSEMTPYQVEIYARAIAKFIGSGGVFFEQNTTDSGPESACPADILPKFFSANRPIETRRPVTQGVAYLHNE